MTGPSEQDGRVVVAWLRRAVLGLERSVDEINALNVFPVADADTGTNMLVTLRAAARAAEEADRTEGPHAVARATVAGAVSGARGNSGVIVSQIMRGVVGQLGPDADLEAAGLAEGLRTATGLVTSAVADPIEGTILSVLRAAADGAAAALAGGADLPACARGAADTAFDALLRTRDQLADNARAGVVDAGGRGLLVLLDALVEVTAGVTPERPRFTRQAAPHVQVNVDPEDAADHPHDHGHDDPPRGPHVDYEVMYLLPDATDAAASRLRDELQTFGDSVVVVAAADPDPVATWSVHAHTTEPGRAIQAGLALGKLRSIAVTVLQETGETPLQALLDAPRAIVALVSGDGAAELFAAEGAEVIRCDEGITHAGLLVALHRFEGREVLLMPNGALPTPELLAVAARSRESGVLVTLLPTSSMVQAIAALAVHDPRGHAADDTFSMAEAAAGARCGSVVAVTEDALTILGPCGPGDYLGMVGGEVVVLEEDQYSAGEALAELLLATGGDMVTVLLGDAGDGDFPDRVAAALRPDRPEVEVVGYRGGQTGSVMEIGVE
ncbi:Dak phosphatase OS=Tsukamurella paurometabola (strain ATCC 8368 / DSM / CCUG 35730 / CIP 100753/ JCM 10117 / KCTC 9821 / NBRC 16120 / NCIMB 702349 / NCTC 13040) OX=521096 GN=Tpau_2834 PE=4 SV=1 [Tsukamurella paurometabola]|uniref:DAK2 domain-containing protein n=1 Tax=Tsukamurella paurometabola TaxID=2061 RepID=UPI000DFC1F2A|nr:DAK2 domain-containing protein [Tsukamurella paurometabola]SUP35708.1 DAK2 domain fusion protein YloV [Tsukamurella paurometabola]